ncbi:MAG: UDP-N-acetylmuramyl-tripeptide synthetase [Parcubacteria group bacterium]|nr:UDP-N-acetylmuramyl-tripeptide synthetase [Parcubacteria group bacterium]
MSALKAFIQSLLPRRLYRALLAPYHLLWTMFAAARYGFPARKLTVIGVTGTKGKSSVTEMVAAILTHAGHTVAVSSTIHFTIGTESRPNRYKMTLPGRGFIQKFLHEAVGKGATHAVIEITSEAALQYRHLFLDLDALVFTNLEKEHLESHGGMEQYFQAKYRIGRALVRSPKRPRAIIANADSTYGARFLALAVERSIPFALADAADLIPTDTGIAFTYEGTGFTLPHPGAFSALNALAAIKTASFFGVALKDAAAALASLSRIAGRAERIVAGQDFLAVVDYAHTPDSLEALYKAYGDRPKICVLGNTGGGRDTWKRPEMGRISDQYCTEVILTDEDPYDEDPRTIVAAMAAGMKRAPTIIMDRRAAIAAALKKASKGDVVLVSGKGTDPYIMRAHGKKEIWSDSEVVREELERLRH